MYGTGRLTGTDLGAGLGAVHDGVALEDGVGVADPAQPLLSGRVARVDDPAVRLGSVQQSDG